MRPCASGSGESWRSAASSTPGATRGTTSGSVRSRARIFWRWEGRTLGELVDDRNADPVDVLCDLLLEEDLRVNQVTPGPWTESLRDFLRHPMGMIGTDSTFVGEKPSPRTYGSFPRVLGQFVREEGTFGRGRGGSAMTRPPPSGSGSAIGVCVRDGFAADLVVFDPERVPLECDLRRAATLSRRHRMGARRR